jgi:phosphopantetheine--protein transferase-like protein
MEEKIREIIATFIKLPAEQIGPATPIDRSAVRSSIMLHRMYARLAEEGLVIKNYTGIRVFGDLMRAPTADPDGPDRSQPVPSGSQPVPSGSQHVPSRSQPVPSQIGPPDSPLTLGIDIEAIASLPRVDDFRTEEFYKMNFTPGEIAYCILQSDPYASFAGLFAAKEALIKSTGSIRETPFNQIEIGHSPIGKPEYPGFTISISHTDGMAVAVAARAAETGSPAQTPTIPKAAAASWPSWLALLLSLIALLVVLLH